MRGHGFQSGGEDAHKNLNIIVTNLINTHDLLVISLAIIANALVVLRQQIPSVIHNFGQAAQLPVQSKLLRIVVLAVQLLQHRKVFRDYINSHSELKLLFILLLIGLFFDV